MNGAQRLLWEPPEKACQSCSVHSRGPNYSHSKTSIIMNDQTSAAASYKELIRLKGRPVEIDAVAINGQTFLISGSVIKTAELKDPWQEDVHDPENVKFQFKRSRKRVDLFKFWQRLPETEPRFPYYHEWSFPAAIPISTHEHWFRKQVKKSVRNKINNAGRHGLEVREEQLSDDLVRRIMEIYNDSPIRRGKRFWHYGKDFETVKRELSDNPVPSTFITAYVDDELIGFIKLFFYDRYAKTTLILDKQSRRDIGCMNSMISKVVQICATRGIPYFVYSYWRRGNHGKFQESNGFTKFQVPSYYVPVSKTGRLALSLQLHRGMEGWIPENMMINLLELRAKFYATRFRTKAFKVKD